jgi:hypothetical protein
MMQKYSGNTDKIPYIPDSLVPYRDEESSSHSGYFSAQETVPCTQLRRHLWKWGGRKSAANLNVTAVRNILIKDIFACITNWNNKSP